MSDLNERRARFVYEGARLAAQAANAPIWRGGNEEIKRRVVVMYQGSNKITEGPTHGSPFGFLTRTRGD